MANLTTVPVKSVVTDIAGRALSRLVAQVYLLREASHLCGVVPRVVRPHVHHGHDEEAEGGPHHVVLYLTPEDHQAEAEPGAGDPLAGLLSKSLHLQTLEQVKCYFKKL